MEQIAAMAQQDWDISSGAHYGVLSAIINANGYEHGIEVGVAYGGHSRYLLDTTRAKIVGVDPFRLYGEMPGLSTQESYDNLYAFTRKRLESRRYELLRMTADEAFVILMERSRFDFVFIDACHQYEDVVKDIANYSLLVRDGGLISGHYYGQFPGVTRAVDEYAGKNGYRVVAHAGTVWTLQKNS